MAKKNHLVSNFSGGMNTRVSPLIIKDSESELILNYNLDTIGALTKRNGYINFANSPSASKSTNGLYQFVNVGAATPNIQLFVQNNAADTAGVIYYRSGGSGSWTAALSTDTISRKTRFATFIGYVFRANGADTARSSADGITWSTVNLDDITVGAALAVTPRYTAVFQDRLYFANGGGATTTSRLWFSSLPATIDALDGAIVAGAATITVDSTTGFASAGTIVIEGDVVSYTGTTATTFTGVTGVDVAHANNTLIYQYTSGTAQEIAWDTRNNYVDINPDDADEITALETNGNRLLIFKNDALYRWTFGQVEADRLIGVGTSSQESVKTDFDRGITFFANPKGIYAYTGGRPKKISRKIQNFIDAVSDWTEVYAGLDEDHYYLAVGNLTLTINGASRTFSNAVLVYHIVLDAWTIYTFTAPSGVDFSLIRFFARLRNSTGSITENLFFGSNAGRVFQYNSGALEVDVTLNSEIVSKEYMLAFPGTMKIHNIDVIANQHVAVNVALRTVRLHDPLHIGKLNDRITNILVGGKECRTAQLVLTDNSANTSVIEGWNIEYEPQPRPNSRVRRSNYSNL